jgi:hypothetical protein
VTEKTPLDQALDLFVYAPLGLALSARDELPKLAERGKQELDGRLAVARTVGQFAMGEATRRLSPPRSGPPIARPDARSGDQNGKVKPPPVRQPAPEAIHGYDALAASQVVQRLAGLSGEELEAVRAYEAATRHRKTILNRVAQLQADADA